VTKITSCFTWFWSSVILLNSLRVLFCWWAVISWSDNSDENMNTARHSGHLKMPPDSFHTAADGLVFVSPSTTETVTDSVNGIWLQWYCCYPAVVVCIIVVTVAGSLWSRSSRRVVRTTASYRYTWCRSRRVPYLTPCTWLTITPVQWYIITCSTSSHCSLRQDQLPRRRPSTSLLAPYLVWTPHLCHIF